MIMESRNTRKMQKNCFMEKLLDLSADRVGGVEVEWKALGDIATLRRGRVMSKGYLIDNAGDYPVYSSQTVTNGMIGRIGTFDFDGEYISWTTDGANAGTVFYRTGRFSITNVCGSIKINDASRLMYKFLFYWLSIEAQKHVYSGMGNPKLMSHQVEKIPIPIPCPENPVKSLEIQAEIVRILDTFTELTARKKQYNYYRDQLLSFDLPAGQAGGVEVEWKALGDVFLMRAGQHISARKIIGNFDESHMYPCFGGNGIRGYVKEKSHEGEYLLIGRQGALCGNVQRMKGKFYATEHAVVVTANREINIDWAFHLLTMMDLNQYASQSAQPGLAVKKLLSLNIPVPSLKEQIRVASVLDKFNVIAHSINEGLPREIELRQKQYEYYRDLLLNFPKPVPTQANS